MSDWVATVPALVRRIPAAAWLCALVAVCNAACWSLITPPFAVPDEPSHFAYVKQIAENGALPSSNALDFSREEEVTLHDLGEAPFSFMAPTGAIASRAQQAALQRDLHQTASEPRRGSPTAGRATSQPPLYYLLETVPYLIGYHATLLTRLELMRLLSALFAGVTAMFAFLFVREVLPGRRPAWTAAGLSVALAPLLGFMSGAVNPDSLLFAVSAVLFWALARAFRLGLTVRRAALIGAALAAGLVTKVNFVGLVPGAVLGLGVLALRMPGPTRRSAWRAFGLGSAIAAAPVALVAFIHLVSGGRTLGLISSAASLVHGSLIDAVGYTWKLFLPHLPGMKPYVAGLSTTRQIWFNGFVGQYGWLETAFSPWVYDVALGVGVAVLLAFFAALARAWRALGARWAELAVYAIMGLGLVALIGGASYFGTEAGASYTQARYLLPLLPLFAVGMALAVSVGGRRYYAVLGPALVLAFLADDIFSQLLVVGRYYG